jgi:SAM-dependent methyltransferase
MIATMTPAADPPPPTSAAAANPSALDSRERFLALFADALAQGALVKLVLGKHVGAEPQLQQLALRAVLLRGALQLSLLYRYQTKDVTKNVSPEEGQRIVALALGADFRNAHLLTRTLTVELSISQRGQCTLRCKALEQPAEGQGEMPAAALHDRAKQRHVALERPFLAGLGVADSQQRLIPAMAHKYKQIDKFVEVFSNALAGSTLAGAKQVRVIDFGSGKGYLTFAVHDHLVHALGVDAQVAGVELRADMVALCNGVATRLRLKGLSFEQGDVTQQTPRATDVMIALHACDTATDHAIRLGVEGGAQIILCAPCCHKEVRPQLLSPQPIRAVLRHGVHLGQEADMVTDALRALLLEASGYATQVFEFVALEHTSKNKMILAVKRPHPADPAPWLEQVAQLKQFYGIREQALERLLAPRLVGA